MRELCLRCIAITRLYLTLSDDCMKNGPNGIRIRVCALKGRRPSPLDDGARNKRFDHAIIYVLTFNQPILSDIQL